MSDQDQTEPEGSKAEPETAGVVDRNYHESQLNEAIKRRNNALKRAQEAEARLAELEEADLDKRRNNAKGPDDHKAVYTEELNKREQRIQTLNDKLNKVVLENQIKAKLVGYTDHIEDSWALLSGQFKVEEEDGELKPVLASNPYADVSEYLKSFFETRPHLSKNPRKPGPGVTNQSKNSYSSKELSISMEEMDALPHSKRIAMQIKDPALAKAYAEYRLRK